MTRKILSDDLAFNAQTLLLEAAPLLGEIANCQDLAAARIKLVEMINRAYMDKFGTEDRGFSHHMIRSRDCMRALLNVLQPRSETRAGFSVAQALWDIAAGRPRPDLMAAFYGEMIHWFRGLMGLTEYKYLVNAEPIINLTGRSAAKARSQALDELHQAVQQRLDKYKHGLLPEARAGRQARRQQIIDALGATQQQWSDWKWQIDNLATDASSMGRLARLSTQEFECITGARANNLPFAVTPYYASLMDQEGTDDRAVRAQVIPTADYVKEMSARRGDLSGCDFMLEADTSPIDLVTRRYIKIAILKPFNTCPQICVYCQRNWQIDQPMAAGAMAPWEKIEQAIDWIAQQPAITEVLVTGGDPLAMDDDQLKRILDRLATIKHVDMIRIGSRMPVTMPMRINQNLAELLGSYRDLGRRDIAVVTHVEHPYEITIDLAEAVDRLRRQGIGVYNQQVYTFFVSRRFETALLRQLLRRVGIDPYYTFAPKGKQETISYRVPVARMLQERKEEARLLSGMRRTDEPVINVPGLGKNYLRVGQHHDILTVMPDGSRVYEFHPWEKNVARSKSYLAHDVPILDYLHRLNAIGEDAQDYASIWYYF